tara:strand:+ start:174 stop:758 length:585 start_codon:yes stop_codon:yes gene_type:complete
MVIKEYKFYNSTFIGGWYIPHNICDELIDTFYKNESKWTIGTLGEDKKLEHNLKKSTEMLIQPNEYDVYTKNYIEYLGGCLKLYKEKYPFSNNVAHYSLNDNIKIQHYKPNEGYFKWHTENEGFGNDKSRHLVFMTYLNTVESAGTEFYHQQLRTPCEKGLTLIWPTAWTHYHKGVISKEKEKFIITGWINFNA